MIFEVSKKKLQDMPTIIWGIVKITEVHPMPSKDSWRSFEDFRWDFRRSHITRRSPKTTQGIPKISRIFSRFFNIIGRFVNTCTLCFYIIMIGYLTISSWTLLLSNQMIFSCKCGINNHQKLHLLNFVSLWKKLLVFIYSKILHSKSCDYLCTKCVRLFLIGSQENLN